MFNKTEAIIEERNAVRKDYRKVDLKIAFCYPSIYRAGMSSLGLQLIYRLFNSYPQIACERSFLPQKETTVPYTLESDQPLKRMDVIAFTLQFEDNYTNVLDILHRSNIPLESKKRTEKDPLIIAGGPTVQANPTPLKPFIDGFMLGDIEPIVDKLLIEGLLENNSKEGQIETLNTFPWMWIPSIEPQKEVTFAPKGDINNYFYPVRQIIPQVDDVDPWHGVFGKTFMLEVVRGCSRNCAFCLTGKLNTPRRDRTLQKCQQLYREGVKHCEVNKITIIGSGIADYPELIPLCQSIVEDDLQFSLPSMRADRITPELMQLLVKSGQRTITTAPEAATQRLRDKICKNLTTEEILQATTIVNASGLSRIKYYFMLGLPSETEEDIEGLVEFGEKISQMTSNMRSVNISCSNFIPKAHTQFQNVSINSIKESKATGKKIRKDLNRIPGITCDVYSSNWTPIQTMLSIGGEEIAPCIKLAMLYGKNLGAWRRAIKETNLNLEKYTTKRKPTDQNPWDFITIG
ncbi:MAG: radical SAM protein [Asgard group archaeon]|nr:radical SAM protein [Asgard group archaeon]